MPKKITYETEELPKVLLAFYKEYKDQEIIFTKNGKEVYKITQERTNPEHLKNFVNDCIAHLNTEAKKRFKVKGKNITLLVALYKENYSFGDVKRVIDNKVAEWLNATDHRTGKPMSNYLRPQTLFNMQNFEGYVNENEPTGVVGDGNSNWKSE